MASLLSSAYALSRTSASAKAAAAKQEKPFHYEFLGPPGKGDKAWQRSYGCCQALLAVTALL